MRFRDGLRRAQRSTVGDLLRKARTEPGDLALRLFSVGVHVALWCALALIGVEIAGGWGFFAVAALYWWRARMWLDG